MLVLPWQDPIEYGKAGQGFPILLLPGPAASHAELQGALEDQASKGLSKDISVLIFSCVGEVGDEEFEKPTPLILQGV